jgi:hypothetical protein
MCGLPPQQSWDAVNLAKALGPLKRLMPGKYCGVRIEGRTPENM